MSYLEGKKTGFTLIELAVVIAIIAILAAVAIPRLGDATEQAERTMVKHTISQLRGAYTGYFAANAIEPAGFSDFVTEDNLQAGGQELLSIKNIGKGGCTVSAATIQCQASDFPKLANQGIVVQFTLQNKYISSNVP